MRQTIHISVVSLVHCLMVVLLRTSNLHQHVKGFFAKCPNDAGQRHLATVMLAEGLPLTANSAQNYLTPWWL